MIKEPGVLFDLFASPGFKGWQYRTEHYHKRGAEFTLPSDIGLVLAGVVSVEALASPGCASPVVVRVAGAGSFLGLEALFQDGQAGASRNGAGLHYVVESGYARISLIYTDYLRKLMQLGSIQTVVPYETRAEIQRGILEALCKQNMEIAETASYLGGCPALERVKWARGRLAKAGVGRQSTPRLPGHVGCSPAHMYRALRQLEAGGEIKPGKAGKQGIAQGLS